MHYQARGSGINAAGGTTFNSSGWTTSTTVNTNDYIEWTVTADADFSIDVSSIITQNFSPVGKNCYGSFHTFGYAAITTCIYRRRPRKYA